MKWIIILSFLFAPAANIAQNTKYSSVDIKVKDISNNKISSVNELAEIAKQNTSNQDELVRFIASWIVNNIKFKNTGQIQSRLIQPVPADKILKDKKANRFDIASLFNEVCHTAGIKSDIIIGYFKDFDYEPSDTIIKSNHCWNAVMIDNKWYAVDLLLMSGHFKQKKQTANLLWSNIFGGFYKPKYKFVKEPNDKFYKIPPSEIIISHLPDNPFWQLNDIIVAHDDFINENHKLKAQKNNKLYNYNDTISHYLHLSFPENYLFIAKNSYSFNSFNHLDIAVYLHLYSKSLFNIVINNVDDLQKRTVLIDSVVNSMDSAIVCYNMYKDDCAEFKAYHLKKNKEFNAFTKDNYKFLSKKNTKRIKYYKKYLNKLKSVSRKSSGIKKYLLNAKSKINSDKFDRTKSGQVQTSDETKFYNQAIQAEIDNLLNDINVRTKKVECFVTDTIPKMFNIISNERNKIVAVTDYASEKIIKNCIKNRHKFSWFNLVYFIAIADTLKNIQQNINNSYIYIIDPAKTKIYGIITNLKKEVRNINKLYDKVYDYYIDMKKHGADLTALNKTVEIHINKNIEMFEYFIKESKKFQSYTKNERKNCLRTVKSFKKQNRLLAKDYDIEHKRYEFYVKKYKSMYKLDLEDYKMLLNKAKSDIKKIKQSKKILINNN